MAMAADSSPNNHSSSASPSSPLTGGDGGGNSPSRRRSLQSPWAQVVVRGVEPESNSTVSAPRSPSSSPPIAAGADVVLPEQTAPPESENSAPEFQPESSDDGYGNAARSKKPAWSKPLNGVVEGTSVMGGSVSWPALSESTRSTGKSSSESLKTLSDGSASSSQGPIISQTPQKQANTNANANSVANHGMPRQRSMRNRGAGSSQGGFNRPSPPTPPPMPPPFPAIIEVSSYGNYGNFVPPVLDSSVRGARPMSGVGSPAGNDHSTHSQRNSSRRNNFGSRPRGDGQYHNNHGGRRDHDRKDVHLPHQFIPPPPPPGGYMPPPPPPSPGSAPFIAPPPMRPFVGPLGFDMPPPYMYVPTLPPFVAAPPPPPMFYPVMDPPLPALIVRQIDYYFSDPNLVKDDYLRSNMDEEGWVPINLIASFPRVQQLTTDIPLILESLRASMVVEIKEQGDKIRRRNDWRKWIHTGGSHVSPDSGSQTPGTASDDILTNSINMISLKGGTTSNEGASESTDSEVEPARSRPSPEDSAGSSIVVANGDVSAEEEFHAS